LKYQYLLLSFINYKSRAQRQVVVVVVVAAAAAAAAVVVAGVILITMHLLNYSFLVLLLSLQLVYNFVLLLNNK